MYTSRSAALGTRQRCRGHRVRRSRQSAYNTQRSSMAFQLNQHVERLAAYQPFDASFGQLYAEYVDTRQSDQLETRAFDFVSEIIHDPNVRVVVLTGDAGHGKTHLCGRLITSNDQSISDPREELRTHGDGATALVDLPNGRALHIIKDLSELARDVAVVRLEARPGRTRPGYSRLRERGQAARRARDWHTCADADQGGTRPRPPGGPDVEDGCNPRHRHESPERCRPRRQEPHPSSTEDLGIGRSQVVGVRELRRSPRMPDLREPSVAGGGRYPRREPPSGNRGAVASGGTDRARGDDPRIAHLHRIRDHRWVALQRRTRACAEAEGRVAERLLVSSSHVRWATGARRPGAAARVPSD